ncbi:MAG: RNA polymerase sigma factor [Bacteroidia bacterium]
MELKDNVIIEEILSGNKEKYALIMRKYNQRLYRICKGYLKDEAEIEDVMQETYIKAFQNLVKFENRSKFSSWLTRILINECLQRLRKMKRETLLDNSEEQMKTMNLTDKKSPETESLNKELKGLLEINIAQLPEKYRAVFIMREVEKMSIDETAESLEISDSNVKVRLNRAKEMLRAALMNTYPIGEVFEFNLVRCDKIAKNVLARI